jgi:hypothetical protein
MSEQSVIVWDLETVPDLAAAARMLDMRNASEAEVREALGPGFPKHPLHKIACIGGGFSCSCRPVRKGSTSQASPVIPECGGSGFIHCCEGERPDQCPERSREAATEPASSDQRREIIEM